MELTEPQKALQQIKRIEQHFLANNQPIIYIQHIKDGAKADFFKRSTKGAELHADLQAGPASIVIEKQFPNSFFQTTLQKQLKALRVEQLVIIGMMTHMCVDSTTRASAELGYQPIVITDATATKALTINGLSATAEQVQTAFLAALQNFAQVETAQQYLAENSAM